MCERGEGKGIERGAVVGRTALVITGGEVKGREKWAEGGREGKEGMGEEKERKGKKGQEKKEGETREGRES